MNHDDHSQHGTEPKPFWGSRYSMGLLVMGAVALYFLLSEHRAHFFGALPFLLLLACPLMHMFMHHDHGGRADSHAHHHGGAPGSNTSPTPPVPKTGERP